MLVMMIMTRMTKTEQLLSREGARSQGARGPCKTLFGPTRKLQPVALLVTDLFDSYTSIPLGVLA